MNIFVADLNSDNPEIKIGDFGLACKLERDEYIITRAGTVGFMAPEIVLRQPSNQKQDIWSLGIIFYALIDSYVPFTGNGGFNISQSIILLEPDFSSRNWQECSAECKDLL